MGALTRRAFHPSPRVPPLSRPDSDVAIVTGEIRERAQVVRQQRAGSVRRNADGTVAGSRRGRGTGPARHLLSGFLRCGVCGNAFHVLYRRYYGCGWHYGRGPEACTNRTRPRREEIEERVLGAIQEQILVPEHVAYVVQKSMQRAQELLDGEQSSRESDEVRLQELEAEIANLIDLAARR